MANRFPLIVDSSALQIKELPANDNLDLSSSGIVGVSQIGIGTTNPVGQLQVSAGPVIIGAATSTGTSSQPLQVTGGAYISGSVGIATTNPTNPFQVGSGTTIVLIDRTGDLGIGTATVPTKLYVQGNAASNIVGLGTTSGTVTLDFTQGNSFTMSISGNITIANPTGVTTGQSGVIFIQEDGTGGYTAAWGTSWDFASSTAPTLTTTANALNALPYFARSTTSIVVGSVIAGIGTL